MTSSNGKIYKLRKINRALFDQLESNSILLENKLRKLKESTRSSKDFAQPCESSSLKKRHRSWKLRNDSAQMHEVLNSEFTMQRSSYDSTPKTKILLDEDKTKELMVARPSVKSKRRKSIKGTKHLFTHKSPEIITQQKTYLESRYNAAENKRNEFLYNTSKNALQINDKIQHLRTLTDSEENISLSKHKKNAQSRKNGVSGRTVDDKLLKEVGNVIDYSPKSTFLQRLKERSQRNACSSIRSPRKSVYINSQTPAISSPNALKKDMKRSILSVGENQMKSSLKEAAEPANSCCSSSPCYCAYSTVSNTPALKAKEIVLKQKKKRNHLKKKRVCYRRTCYCRKAFKGVPPGNKKTAQKENLPSTADEVDKSPSTPYLYRTFCNLCSPHSAQSKVDNAVLGHSFSIRDEGESPHCCTCQETGSWFKGLRNFRDSHWFDCHAKPISVCAYADKHRILQNHCKCYQEDQHTCVHHYVVNDRLFMQPVCADHKGRSRCVYCKLPRKRETTSNFPHNKTEPSKEEVLVSLPLSILSSERNQDSILSNKREDSKKSTYKRSLRQKRSPLPANSLALRFQKGIL